MLLNTIQPRKPLLSMTPLIDVVFILLLFFMITTSFQTERFIPVHTAKKDDNASSSTTMPLQILLQKDGTIWLDGEAFPAGSSAFQQALTSKNAEQETLILAGEPEVKIQNFVALIDALKSQGFLLINIAKTQSL